jgi:ABC-type multidrug transport system ATPase subunit
LEILTGGLDATSGEAFINGFNIKNDRLNAIRSLGYCPQFDHLPEFLTVRETLELFANLRHVNKMCVEDVVNEYLNIFRLYEFKNILVQNLSGGNKRKVSSAIAFIGKPKTVILDEVILKIINHISMIIHKLNVVKQFKPTCGMDVAARRYLWNVIKSARDLGTTILLTTHRYKYNLMSLN